MRIDSGIRPQEHNLWFLRIHQKIAIRANAVYLAYITGAFFTMYVNFPGLVRVSNVTFLDVEEPIDPGAPRRGFL